MLKVISRSPTELQPVLDALAESAARFCGADDVVIFRLESAGLPIVAHFGSIPAPVRFGAPVSGTASGRSILERRTIDVADLQAEAEAFPEGSAFAQKFDFRTLLSVPLVREDVALGAIFLRRTEVAPFTEKQIDLVTTFADQAVIAIENTTAVRGGAGKNERAHRVTGVSDGDERRAQRHQPLALTAPASARHHRGDGSSALRSLRCDCPVEARGTG